MMNIKIVKLASKSHMSCTIFSLLQPLIMRQSIYLEQILFYNQSTETDKTLNERSSEIFEKVETNSFVEIYVPIFETYVPIHSNSTFPSSFTSQRAQVKLDVESSNPPSPVDHCSYLRRGPPSYVGSRGWHHRRVSSSQELRNIATVRLVNDEVRRLHVKG